MNQVTTFPGQSSIGESDSGETIRVRDPQTAEPRWYTAWAAPYLNDARDVVFIGLMIESAVALACGVAVWLSSAPLLLVAPVYLIGLALWALDRFTLMLHCTSHRPLFKPRYRAYNRLIPWVLGPVFGHTPNTYFAHHLGMHHREENLKDDLSATIAFRRDRLDHWLRYYLRFLLIGLPELSLYFARGKRYKMLTGILVGEGLYWAVVFGLAYVKPWHTLLVLVAPLLLIRTLMMMGNWGQHAFVCQEHPEDPYRASITCINTRYNRRCFNDGYHVLHHIQPRCHWTEHPREFEKSLSEYAKHDSIVFDGLDFFQVWVCLMFRRYSVLAKHFVQLPGAPVRSESEIIAFLKGRVQPLAAAPSA
jgi:fatty acid desaturase